MNKSIFVNLFLCMVLNLIGENVQATATPVFAIKAITKAPQQLLANSIVTVQYKVTNNSKITRTLTVSPIFGIEQVSGTNLCSNPFTLNPGKSCLLNLRLKAAQLGTGVHSGPVICKTAGPNDNTPNPFLCSQPAAQDSLNITIIPCTPTTCLNAHQAQLLRAITKHYEQQYQIPGVLAGIWIPGKGQLIIEDGVADISTNRPISSSDHVRIASITKSFTTTVILQLAQEGLNLNAPISNFGFTIQNNNATVGQLADMRSGIFNYSADPTFLQNLIDNLLRKWLPQELVSIANNNLIYFPPGTNWHYSNTNTIILGMIIEQITGHFVGNEIKNRLITPLGLTQTSYPTSPVIPAPFARGYAAGQPLEDITTVDPSFSGAAGAMISTMGDLKKWAKALATGSVLSPAMQLQRINSILPMSFDPCADNDPTRPHPTCPEYDQYGYGLGTIAGWRGHTGDYLGYLSLIMHEPTSGATIVIIVNISGVGIHIPTNLFREYLAILNS